MPFPEPKRQFAFRWLREQENAKALRERQLYRYAEWTFWAAVAAAIIAFVGGLIALLAWIFPR
jgi:ABC-type Fe3+ transport system permease subunit